MQLPTYEDFMRNQESDTAVKEKKKKRTGEIFLIQHCPTPGCMCKQVRTIIMKGKIGGFTCSHGCHYKAKRNLLTGRIEYFELDSFNPYACDPDVRGHRVTRTGAPYIDWH